MILSGNFMVNKYLYRRKHLQVWANIAGLFAVLDTMNITILWYLSRYFQD